MIEKLNKVTYKQKKVKFDNGILLDENGEVIELSKDLESIYGNREFDIMCAFTNKSEHEVEDFTDK